MLFCKCVSVYQQVTVGASSTTAMDPATASGAIETESSSSTESTSTLKTGSSLAVSTVTSGAIKTESSSPTDSTSAMESPAMDPVADSGTVETESSSSTEPTSAMETASSPTMDSAVSAGAVTTESVDFSACQHEVDSLTSYRAVVMEILPLPKCSTVRQRKRKIEDAEVLTASPYKNRLMDKLASKTGNAKPKLVLKSLHTEHAKQNCKPRPTSKQQRKDIDKRAKNGKGKKKMTCRADKPRGRKPKTSSNVKKMQLSSKRAEESGPKKKEIRES